MLSGFSTGDIIAVLIDVYSLCSLTNGYNELALHLSRFRQLQY